jgi:hypothetical protein
MDEDFPIMADRQPRCQTCPSSMAQRPMSQKTENSWSTFEDLKGRSVATVSGFALVPELMGAGR